MKKCKCCGSQIKKHSSSLYCSGECKIMSNYKKVNECHEYIGLKDRDGYGYGFNKEKAHRIACRIKHGPAPIDKPYALHSCDNPSCINPDHLRWGNPQENSDDKMLRNPPDRKGSSAPCVKLTEEDVKDIIQLLKTNSVLDISKQYNVSRGAIYNIKNNLKWKHIPR